MSEVMSFIGRKYKLERSENFDAYLKELGKFSLKRRKIFKQFHFVIRIRLDNTTSDKINLIMSNDTEERT